MIAGGRRPPMRVLLVEDEPHAANVLAKGLREQAYAVDLAADGDTAIIQVGTTDYDAVILDVMLPIKDGFTVCRTIRASGCDVPILMLTARDATPASRDWTAAPMITSSSRSTSVSCWRGCARSSAAVGSRCCPSV